MTGYSETIRRYALDTRFVGELSDADGTGEVGLGADEAGRKIAVRFTLRVRDRRLAEVRFQVFGCGYSVAACAAAAEMASGVSLEKVPAIDAAAIDGRLEGLPAERSYCADLAAKALRAAVLSVSDRARSVRTDYLPLTDDHSPRVAADDPLYRSLVDSPPPAAASEEDRHLFACLLAVAAKEPCDTAAALGLADKDLADLLRHFFPAWDPGAAALWRTPGGELPPAINPDVRQLLLSHVPGAPSGGSVPTARWLARILAARAAHPGHLWVAMGLFERPQLSAAIRRHLPTLFAANDKNMRWKRFFFKQVCDLNGGLMCKTPNCGECSDYALCFGEEE